jgi:hypothetical protein
VETRDLELAMVEGALDGAPLGRARVARLARLLGCDARLLLHFPLDVLAGGSWAPRAEPRRG